MKFTIFFSLIIFTSNLWAGPREQAYRLHNRIVGVPPQKVVLDEMENLIRAGKPKMAAYLAMNNPKFYNSTIKNWVKPWTNEQISRRVPLNDYVATVIGMVRDGVPFDQVLYGDILYAADDSFFDGENDDHSASSNRHYEKLENDNVNLFQVLQRRNVSQEHGIDDVGGVLVSRAAAMAFFDAGTNRAMTRFTFMNFMCKDFEELHDVNVPDYRVRRDVSRAPGGDSRVYRNKCVGCHAGQDALGGAFAYFNWDGSKIIYTDMQVANKINQIVNFPDGHVVTDDYWINLWAQGQNANLGWRGEMQGYGVNAFGKMIAHSKAFANCMSNKTFELFCHKTASTATEKTLVETLARNFEANAAYDIKELMASSAISCLGD
ncbi:MAG: hypothetical protein JNM93_12760 [Bacteriovoracaceae bacterium]|nr:hypothetical protein [Bacteriovoracaceae bacterium]